ncbi:hypothetical protein B0H11DRAFT_1971230 [Mycena galericulata]|nr:hypothetical protein B0H11DRAFT_1971230 [Mycena galericulata]
MADSPWIQSLRGGSSPRRSINGSHILTPQRLSESAAANSASSKANVKRRSSAPCVDAAQVGTVSNSGVKTKNMVVAPKSRRNKRADPPLKCPNLCCDFLSANHIFFQSYPQTITTSRMNYFVEHQDILNQISRAEAEDALYAKEIPRLKRLVAACPPPDRKAIVAPAYKVASKHCTRACCDTSTLPPRASTEMLRLRHIIQILQIRRQEISVYLRWKHSMLSPIRRLPPEILQMVFAFTLLPNKLNATSPEPFVAVKLSHVCSHWRRITLNTRTLWTTILLRRPPSQHKSSIAHLKVYASNAQALPLTIACSRTYSGHLMSKLIHMSHRWRDITLEIPNDMFEKLAVVRGKLPLLKSLCIHNASMRDGAQTNDAFEQAPSLRRVVLTVRWEHIWPFSFILPWEQITSLTLKPISLSVFSECLRNCPKLLYFSATLYPRPAEVVQQMAELRSPLRKLVLRGWQCQEVVTGHTFPNMVSLSIDINGLHPEFFAFLARSSHLEMIALREGGTVTTEDVLALLLATPSLRILHFQSLSTALVTTRFTGVVAAPPADYAFLPVEPKSLAELEVETCFALDDLRLLAVVQSRTERLTFLDPHGIDQARLEIRPLPFDPEAELEYLS